MSQLTPECGIVIVRPLALARLAPLGVPRLRSQERDLEHRHPHAVQNSHRDGRRAGAVADRRGRRLRRRPGARRPLGIYHSHRGGRRDPVRAADLSAADQRRLARRADRALAELADEIAAAH